jgi:hypothetical protein
LTLLKAKHSEFVFDGFSSVSWESNPEGEWKFDPNAFVYSLINKDKTPFKMKIIQNEIQNAIESNADFGLNTIESNADYDYG